MNYVDGFVTPVPKKKLAAYRTLSKFFGKIWIELGALSYRECIADDVKSGKLTSFPQSVKLKSGEVVAFAWIEYRSRAHRDQLLAKAFADPRVTKRMKQVPFDMKRMIFGGFRTIVAVDPKK